MYEVRKHVTDKKLKDYGFRFKSDGDYTYRTVIYQDGKRPIIFLTFIVNLEEKTFDSTVSDNTGIYYPYYDECRQGDTFCQILKNCVEKETRKLVKAGIIKMISIENIKGTEVNSTTIKLKKLRDNVQIPTRGSEYAAGYDLYAAITSPVIITPHTTVKIGTGIAVEIPNGYFGAVFARSGLATKEGLRPANAVGVCDSDYRGEYIVALHNDSDTPRTVTPGERIAQLVIMPYLQVDFEEVNELSDTVRGEGGFGSTGKAWLWKKKFQFIKNRTLHLKKLLNIPILE